ncbi:MAG: Calx-beta domain-containing protein, partial [Verrucomicrobiota bacterium]
TAIVAWHEGVLFAGNEQPGSAFGDWDGDGEEEIWENRTWAWDISGEFLDNASPSAPKLIESFAGENHAFSAHGSLQAGDLWVSNSNYHVNRSGEGDVITRGTSGALHDLGFDLPNRFGRSGLHPPFDLPMINWYGSPTDPTQVERIDKDGNVTELFRWNHFGQTGVQGHSFLLGNVLIVAGDHNGRSGIATYDISSPGDGVEPKAPVLLDRFNTPEGLGGYWPEIWASPEDGGRVFIIFPARNGTIQFAEVTDPTNIRHAGTMSDDDGTLPSPGGDTAYAQVQDNFAFVNRHKIDLSFLIEDRDPVIEDAVLSFDVDNGGNGYYWKDLDYRGDGYATAGMTQFAMPLGNLVIGGGYGKDSGLSIWVHDEDMDTNEPYIAYHRPLQGETLVPVHIPVNFIIPETLETGNLINGQTFFCRPVSDGTDTVPGVLTFSMNSVLTFAPDDDLQPGVEYEVLVARDAVKDAAGNLLKDVHGGGNRGTGKEIAYRLLFTTDDGSNERPEVESFEADPGSPIALDSEGEADVSFTGVGTDDNDNLEWRIDFGESVDGQRQRYPASGWESGGTTVNASANYTYTKPGNYRVSFQVREAGTDTRIASESLTLVIHPALPDTAAGEGYPTRSSTITIDESTNVAWVVEPDNDIVRRINITAEHGDEDLMGGAIAVGKHPSSVAVDKEGRAWVTCRDDDTIWILNSGGGINSEIELDYGARPVAIAFDPAGEFGYVSEEGSGRITKVSADDLDVVGSTTIEDKGLFLEVFKKHKNAPITDPNQLTDEGASARRLYSGIWRDKISNAIYRELAGNANSPEWKFKSPPDAFIARGHIEIPQSAGDWKFQIETSTHVDERVSLWINGEEVAVGSGLVETSNLDLDAGLHRIELRFLKVDGSIQQMYLRWSSGDAGVPLAEVPLSAFVIPQQLAKPGALAVSADGQTVVAAQSINSAGHQGAVLWKVDAGLSASPTPVELGIDGSSKDNTSAARGVPNYLAGLALDWNSSRAWYAAKKDNVVGGSFRERTVIAEETDDEGNVIAPPTWELNDKNSLTFETTLRAMVAPAMIDEANDRSVFHERMDLDNMAQPSAVAYSGLGTQLFVPMLGNNRVLVIDPFTAREIGRFDVGLAPMGIAIVNSRGSDRSNRVLVHNFMSRSVMIFDGTSTIEGGVFDMANAAPVELDLVPSESELSEEELRGKQLFYSATEIDPEDLPEEDQVTGSFQSRINSDGYISCAACHLDGGQDGTVLDFSNRGEGLRNTTDLRGRRGTGHGNVHWSGNFDEIHDFELDIVNHFAGSGLIEDGDPNDPLGTSNAGRSEDLDALAAYVESLGHETIPKSPYRNPDDGSLTADAQAGRELFLGNTIPTGMTESLSCVDCHNPSTSYTDSTLGAATLHDMGTMKDRSGSRLGETLDGIDTPTLLGVYFTAPYLHDGSAPTLDHVFEQGPTVASGGTSNGHGMVRLMNADQRAQLVRYLLELDGSNDSSVPDPATHGTLELAVTSTSVSHDGGSVGPFTVTRSGGTTGDVSVQYRTVNGTATGGDDFDSASGVLSFADGETTAEIPAIAIHSDTDVGDENFLVELVLPNGGVSIDPAASSVEVTITGFYSRSPAVFTASMEDQQSDNDVDQLLTDEMEAARYAGQNRNKAGLIVIELPSDLSQDNLDNLSNAKFEMGLSAKTFIGSDPVPNVDLYALKMDDSATIDPADWDGLYGNMADS